MYTTKYTIPFKSVNDRDCLVEIQKDGYSGAVIELKAGASPFTVDIGGDDFLYAPNAKSTATIGVVGGDYLQDLFSINPRESRVLFSVDGVIVWRGFVAPEVYTQDYSTALFELEIECKGALSVLEDIDYVKTSADGFISLWDIILKCVTASMSGYETVIIPKALARSSTEFNGAFVNALQYIMVSEDNFFDEENTPTKLSDVLDEVCKLFSWTCIDWSGAMVFRDVDNKAGYMAYNVATQAYIPVSVPILSVQEIGFAGTGSTLDKIPGYNKASVNVSTYSAGNVLPSGDVEDYDTLPVFYEQESVNQSLKLKLKQLFYVPKVLKAYGYTSDEAQTEIDYSTLTPTTSLIFGALYHQRALVKTDGTDVNYNFGTDLIRVCCIKNFYSGFPVTFLYRRILDRNKPLIELTDSPAVAMWKGAFSLNLSVQAYNNEYLQYWGDTSLDYFIESMNDWAQHLDNQPNINVQTQYVKIKCSLWVGNYYYNGSEFVDDIDPHIPDSAKYFYVEVDKVAFSTGAVASIVPTKTLEDPYSGLTGYLIKLPTTSVIYGKVNFKMYGLVIGTKVIGGTNTVLAEEECSLYGYSLSGLKFGYKVLDEVQSFISKNADFVYENEVNDSYMNECEEIKLNISSWNNDEISYSKAIVANGRAISFMSDNLYFDINAHTGNARPEELIVHRIVSQYNAVKVKTKQTINLTGELTPINYLSDTFWVNKRFSMVTGQIDYKNEAFEATMIEAV